MTSNSAISDMEAHRHDLDGVERGKFVVVLRNHDRRHFKIFELPEGQTTEFDDNHAERKWLHPELGLDHHLVGFFEIGQYESGDDLISIQQNSIEYLNREVTEAADEIERLRAALEFYASGIGHTEIDDNGATAKAALSQESADEG